MAEMRFHAGGSTSVGYGRLGYALLGMVAALVGCGKTEAPAAGPAASGAPAAVGTAKPGYARGSLTQDNGVPVAVAGAKLTVSLWGISSKSGEKVYYTPQVNADGTYEQKLVEGSYQFSGATIDVVFNGKHYLYALEPQGEDHVDREAEKGIVQNYVWKLHGLRRGQDADEANFTHWYGASVNMQFHSYRNDTKKSVTAPPVGTKYVFTLIPEGKLVDGSEGKPLTFTRTYGPLLGGLDNNNLPDIPLGVYTVKGEEITPGGVKTGLLMETEFAKYEESKKVEFQPGASNGPWPTSVNFVRQEK